MINLLFKIDKKLLYVLNLILIYYIYKKFDYNLYECSPTTHLFGIISGALIVYYNCNPIVFIIGASLFNFHVIHELLKKK